MYKGALAHLLLARREKIEQLRFSGYSSVNYPSVEIVEAMVGKGTGTAIVVSGTMRDDEEYEDF